MLVCGDEDAQLGHIKARAQVYQAIYGEIELATIGKAGLHLLYWVNW